MINDNANNAGTPAIVLVHGAWADSSCWNAVIPLLQADGFAVYAPPNPLRGLATDAASIADFLKTIPGPVILVGHSYGGSVTSVASARCSNVKALVFIDAFVPDTGESCLSLLGTYPSPPNDLFTPVWLEAGDTDMYFSRKYFGPAFATGVDAKVAAVMAVTQRPVSLSALNENAPAEHVTELVRPRRSRPSHSAAVETDDGDTSKSHHYARECGASQHDPAPRDDTRCNRCRRRRCGNRFVAGQDEQQKIARTRCREFVPKLPVWEERLHLSAA
jgi:pimeloyl-ACP methyl ester carboxylesterase